MKSLLILSLMTLSTQVFADSVTCRSTNATQLGGEMKVDAEISFELSKKEKSLSKISGHIFVQSPYAEADEEVSVENSYMGFFKFDKLASNPNYKPLKYDGYTQFQDFDAAHTTGQEDGMWGAFVIDLNSKEKLFSAHYIFRAGDHMGGTVHFTCRR